MENFYRKEPKKESVYMNPESWKSLQSIELISPGVVAEQQENELKAEILSISYMTPDYELREIYERNKAVGSQKVFQNLALNISTPADILIELAGDYGDLILQNPVSKIIMEHLQDWSWYYAMSPKLLHRVELPEAFDQQAKIAEYFVRYDLQENLAAMCKNASTNNDLLCQLPAKLNPENQQRLIESTEIRSEPLKYFFELDLKSQQTNHIPQIINNPSFDQAWLLNLIENNKLERGFEKNLIIIIAKSPESSPEVLDYIVTNYGEDICIELAKLPNLSPNALEKLAKMTPPYIRYAVADHPNITVTALDQLSEDANEWTRVKVAQNPRTSSESLDKLCKDQHEQVRCAVAQNPNTPLYILHRLLEDNVVAVMEALAKNPVVTGEILVSLYNKNQSMNVIFNIFINPNTPIDLVLEIIRLDKKNKGFYFLNSRLPGYVLKRFESKDPHEMKQLNVFIANCQSLDFELFRGLYLLNDPEIMETLQHNRYIQYSYRTWKADLENNEWHAEW